MELCQEATKQMNVHKYSFIHCSSTDIERLASFKNANNRIIPKRALITDAFQKDILDLFSRTAGKQSSCFDFGQVFTYNEHNQKLKEWMITNGFTMFVRATPKFHSYLDHLLPILPATETLFIYSMWNGYITNGSTQIPNTSDFKNTLPITKYCICIPADTPQQKFFVKYAT